MWIRGMLGCATVLVITMAVAPAAGADTFCVERAGCADPGHNFTTIKQAIEAADANDPKKSPFVADLILVGDGVFHEPVDDGVDNPVNIIGSGPRAEGVGTLIERDPGENVRTVQLGTAIGGQSSTIHDLTIEVASGNMNTGLLVGGDASNVTITAATSPALPTNSRGIDLNGNGPTTVSGADVDVPGTGNIGVLMHLAKLEGSTVRASTGLQGDGTIHGSTIEANLGARSSELKLEDSVMRISGPNGVALSAVGIGFNVLNRVKARHVTVIGDSDPTSVAVLAEAEGTTSNNYAEAEVRSSILRGFATNFKRSAINSKEKTGTAKLTVAYSDYDMSIPKVDSGKGPGTLDDATGNISADPLFRSATDLRLSPGSALIDSGDPASPDTSDSFQPDSLFDFEGLPRSFDGDGDGVARADIGAFEFQPEPPPLPPVLDTIAPRITLRGRKVQRGAKLVWLKVTSDEAAEVKARGNVTIQASKRKGSSARAAKRKRFRLQGQTKRIGAGGTRAFTLRLPKGARRAVRRAQARGQTAKAAIRVTATDAAGNQAAAKRNVRLKRKKRRRKRS